MFVFFINTYRRLSLFGWEGVLLPFVFYMHQQLYPNTKNGLVLPNEISYSLFSDTMQNYSTYLTKINAKLQIHMYN